MNIYQRLNEVRKSVDYLEKDKQVGGKYWAVTHDSVTAAIRNALIEQGVIIVPVLLTSQSVMTTITTGKGIPYIRYEAKYSIAFVNMDDPLEKVEVVVESHAMDEGDKAPGKAISYATKYAMLKLFSIESGDHEEERPEVKVAKDREKAFEKPHKPTDGAWEAMEPDMQTYLLDLAGEVRSLLQRGDFRGSAEHINEKELDNDTKTALWTRFDSKERSALKKAFEEIRKVAA